jgi:predicted ATPase
MVLNEPEASLHSDLIAPLARLLRHASRNTQIVVISHADALIEAIADTDESRHIILDKQFGETLISNDDRADWIWPAR